MSESLRRLVPESTMRKEKEERNDFYYYGSTDSDTELIRSKLETWRHGYKQHTYYMKHGPMMGHIGMFHDDDISYLIRGLRSISFNFNCI